MESWLAHVNLKSIVVFSKAFFAYCMLFPAAFLCARRNKKLAAFYAFAALLESCIFLTGANWGQYALVCFCQIVLLLNEISYIPLKTNNVNKFVTFGLILCVGLFLQSIIVRNILPMMHTYNKYSKHIERSYESLIRVVPEQELASFVACGGNQYKELYLLTDILPCYRYFVIQPWHSLFSERIRKDILHTFESGNAQWLLADTDGKALIADILSSRYDLVAENAGGGIYHLRKSAELPELTQNLRTN